MTDRFTPHPRRQVQLRPLDRGLAGRRRVRWRRTAPARPGGDRAPARRARRRRRDLPRRRPAPRRGHPRPGARPLQEGPRRDRHGRRDGDDEPLQPRRVQGRRPDRQRPRRPPLRRRQGAAQRRPGARAGARPTCCGAAARVRSPAATRTSPPRSTATRRAWISSAPMCATRATTSASPSSPSRTSPRRHPAAHHRPRARVHRRAGGAGPHSPEVGHEEMAEAELRAGRLAGAVARQALPRRTSTASTARASTRTCASARATSAAFWTVDLLGAGTGRAYDGYVHFDYKPPRTEDIGGVWETRSGLHAQLPDPAGEGAGVPDRLRRRRGARGRQGPASSPSPRWATARASRTSARRRTTPTRWPSAAWSSSGWTSSPWSICSASADAPAGRIACPGRVPTVRRAGGRRVARATMTTWRPPLLRPARSCATCAPGVRAAGSSWSR